MQQSQFIISFKGVNKVACSFMMTVMQLLVSMCIIGSLICNQNDKLCHIDNYSMFAWISDGKCSLHCSL